MPANVGSQTVSVKYHDPVDSYIVNERHDEVRERGIYSGGYLTVTGANTVSLSALVCEIGDANYQVKVKTSAAVSITCSSVNVYIVLRWTYSGDASADYMDFIATNSPASNDLIVGKVVYSGGVASSIDYGDATYPRTEPDIHRLFLKVVPTETPGTSVRIRPGSAHTGTGFLSIADQTHTPPSRGTASSGDVVYVYINDTGGIESSKTVADYAGKALLAKITMPVGGVINTGDIEDARCFIDSPAIPDGTTIERSSIGKLQVKDGGISEAKISFSLASINFTSNINAVDVTVNVATSAFGGSYTTVNLSSVVGSNRCIVLLKVKRSSGSSAGDMLKIRDPSDNGEPYSSGYQQPGVNIGDISNASYSNYLVCTTSSSGRIEAKTTNVSGNVDFTVIAWVIA